MVVGGRDEVRALEALRVLGALRRRGKNKEAGAWRRARDGRCAGSREEWWRPRTCPARKQA